MRATTKFLISLAISSTLGYNVYKDAYPVEDECENALRETILGDSFFLNDCYGIGYKLNEYGKLEKNYDICKNYNTSKCQEYYDLRVSDIPECENSNINVIKAMDFYIEMAYVQMRTLCTKDESGNYCKLFENDITNALLQNQKDQLMDMVNETCKSRKCTRNFLNYDRDMKAISEIYGEYVDEYTKIIDDKLNEIPFNSDSLSHIISEEIEDLKLSGHTEDYSRTSNGNGHTEDYSRTSNGNSHTEDYSRTKNGNGHTEDYSRTKNGNNHSDTTSRYNYGHSETISSENYAMGHSETTVYENEYDTEALDAEYDELYENIIKTLSSRKCSRRN
ncbi:hypothetical protein BCR32DRAFT_251128 [Anaeromyces robustus]|uniref:Uncharacterized protein n=1 Tax=Anaeromyces robustus TaxID=1754192 RepID=A0A1Y1VUG2_9FUNG|nr:hypothetical protein BCR32DRAFT_251128 [Anaeromyces robustus]|eukprot:ORX64384.1 hypothetical protein BCR32DRAFT_251128 [Anaeromyces robustus]